MAPRNFLLLILATLGSGAALPALATHTAAPSSVTAAGSFQSEAGCTGDWQPDCSVTQLTYDANDAVWQGSWALPGGNYEFKAALDNSWNENYGANATQNGSNIALSLTADTTVKFYYDHLTHWIASNRSSVIATAAGSFQSELGCSGDWDPGCLRSWLQDPDGNGIYTFSTMSLPAGFYEVKAAIDESWVENYGLGGIANGPNVQFNVLQDGAPVTFIYERATNILTVQVAQAQIPEPGALSLLGIALAGLVFGVRPRARQ